MLLLNWKKIFYGVIFWSRNIALYLVFELYIGLFQFKMRNGIKMNNIISFRGKIGISTILMVYWPIFKILLLKFGEICSQASCFCFYLVVMLVVAWQYGKSLWHDCLKRIHSCRGGNSCLFPIPICFVIILLSKFCKWETILTATFLF